MENNKTLLVLILDDTKYEDFESEYLNELSMLSLDRGLDVKQNIVVKVDTIDEKTYVDQTSLEEIKVLVKEHKIDMLVFSNELSGKQMKNLEDTLSIKIIDRTILILDILASRDNNHSYLNGIELAQNKYRLDRLEAVSSEKFNVVNEIGTIGPDGKKLALDRNIIKENIEWHSDYDSYFCDRQRSNCGVRGCAIVGYTNSGKSTIFNVLMDKCGFRKRDDRANVDDKIFSAIKHYNPIIRINKKLLFVNEILGFVSDMPEVILNTFSGRMKFLKEADYILNIIDVTAEDYEFKTVTTLDNLMKIGVPKDMITDIFNKSEKTTDIEGKEREFMTWTRFAMPAYSRYEIGVIPDENNNEDNDYSLEDVDYLIEDIGRQIFGISYKDFIFPKDQLHLIDELKVKSEIVSIREREDGVMVSTIAADDVFLEFNDYMVTCGGAN